MAEDWHVSTLANDQTLACLFCLNEQRAGAEAE